MEYIAILIIVGAALAPFALFLLPPQVRECSPVQEIRYQDDHYRYEPDPSLVVDSDIY